MHKHPTAPRGRIRRSTAAAVIAAVAASAFLAAPSAHANEPADPPAAQMPAPTPGFPLPTEHSQEAYAPESDFTSKWTRADARQLKALSDPTVAPA